MFRLLLITIFTLSLCQCAMPPRKSAAKKKRAVVKEEPVKVESDLDELTEDDMLGSNESEAVQPAIKTPPTAQTAAEKVVEQAAVETEPVLEAKPVTEVPKPRPPKGVPCPSDLKKMKSPSAKSAESKIRFRNESDDMIDVIWFGFDGAQKKYKTLGPDEQYDQSSFVGHYWALMSSTGQCLGVYSVTSKLSRAVVRSN